MQEAALPSANVAVMLVFLNIIMIIFYGISQPDFLQIVALGLLMFSSMFSSFIFFAGFQFAWAKKFGPGSYWPIGTSFGTLFNDFLAPFYMSHSALLSLAVGTTFLVCDHDILDVAWHALVMIMVSPALVVFVFESSMYFTKTEHNP